METTATNPPLRFVIHHLHPTSARLRFLKSPAGRVIFPTPLPALSELLEEYDIPSATATHPAPFLRQLCATLQVEPHELTIVNGFRLWVDTPGVTVPVYLVKVQKEQPFAAPKGCQWIELPDCFSLPAIERLVMRQIYDFLLGNG